VLVWRDVKSNNSRASGVRESDRQPRLLAVLAEDDDGIQWALTEALTDAGFDVIAVAEAARLREVLRERTPDVLVADYQLLDDTTEEVVIETVAQAVAQAVALRVVMVSAAPAARTLANRLAIPHIAKPFELDHLIAVVSDLARMTAA
jgi:DNA-binding NtrC family response regulator